MVKLVDSVGFVGWISKCLLPKSEKELGNNWTVLQGDFLGPEVWTVFSEEQCAPQCLTPAFGFFLSSHSLLHSAPYFSNMCSKQSVFMHVYAFKKWLQTLGPCMLFSKVCKVCEGMVGWAWVCLLRVITSLSDNVTVRKRCLAALGTTSLCTQVLKSLWSL